MHRGEHSGGAKGPGAWGLLAGMAGAATWPGLPSLSAVRIETSARLSSVITRYTVAVLAIAVAVALAKTAVAFLQTEPFVSVFLCTVMLVAWFGGLGPALLATGLALLAFDYFFLPPINSLVLAAKDIPRMALFTVAAVLVSLMTSAQRRTARSLQRSRDELLDALEDQKRIEARLLKSEMYLDEAQRLSLSGSFGWNIDTGEITWSEETYRIFDYDRAKKPTLDFIQRVHPADRAEVQRTIEIAASAGRDFAHEYRLLMPDGSVKFVRALAHTVQAASGEIEFVGAVMDITEARQAEEELRKSEQRFRDFAETASDWFWETGPDHRFLSVSRETTAVAGRTGAAIWEFANDVEEEPEKWRLHWATLDARASFRDFRFRGPLPDGTSIYLAASGKPMFDASGSFVGYRGVASDVTATVRAEQAEADLQQARADLAHATRVTTLGELTASIAHEVNQPLAAIVANAEACLRWLDRDTPNMEAARRSVEWVVSDGNRAAQVISRVRALAAKTSSERSRLNVNDVINEASTLVRRELSDNRVSLRIDLEPTALMVDADRVQLHQVIINLVMNGIEAMHSVDGWPRELAIRSLRIDADQVLVAVEDRGVGISAESAGRLFDAFFTTKSNGLGLGLSICRSIIDAHGGRLSASGNVHQGATFQFTLPLHQDEEQRFTSP